MPTLDEIGLEPMDDSLVEVNKLEPIENDKSLVEVNGLELINEPAVGRAEDVYHRYMGALTNSTLGAAEATTRFVGLTGVTKYLEDKGKEVRAFSRENQNPEFDTQASSGIAQALGTVTSLAPSMFVPGSYLPAILGGTQAAASSYSDVRARAFEEGKNEETANLEGLKQAGFVAATMPLYLAGGKVASELAGKYLPVTASKLTRFGAGAAAASTVNVATSAAVRGLGGEPVIPQDAAGIAATLTQDLGFGLLHGYGESRLPDAVRNAVGQRKAVELNMAAADDMLAIGKIDAEDHAHLQFRNKEYLGGLDQFIKRHQKLADAVGGKKSESELDAYQKELEAIDATPDESFNETQTKAPTEPSKTASITEPAIQEPTATSDPNAPVTTPTIPETVRVRSAADPVFKQHADNVYKLTGQEQVDYLAKNKLAPDDFGIEEKVAEIPGTAPVVEQSAVAAQPEAIAAPSVTPKLQAKIEVFDRAAKAVTKGWANAPEIIVVPRVEQLPESAISPQDRPSITGKSVDGLLGRDGKVYLIGDKLPSVNRAKEVILHEVKGHFGLKGLFGEDAAGYNQAMKSAWTEFQARPALLEQFAKRAGLNSFKDLQEVYKQLDLETPEGRAAMADELLARAAEIYSNPANPRPTWFNTIVAKVKVALQKVMPSMKLTDQDIVSLLSSGQKKLLDRASDVVEQGSPETVSQEPKLSATKLPSEEPVNNINYQRITELGFTNDFREAGYLTLKGKLIDLSGKNEGGQSGTRSYDHREAGGSKGMLQFMNQGNIRLFPESGGMDIIKNPTPEQQEVIKRFIDFHDGKVVIDLADGLGTENDYAYNDPSRKASVEFLEGTKANKVLGIIKRFYSGEDIKSGPKFSMAGKEPAPAVHIGDQQFEGQKLPFFNLTRDIPGHVKDSTVSVDTLLEAGFDRPEGYTGGFEKANLPQFSMTGHPQSDKILNELNTKANKAQTKLFDDFNALATVEKGLNLGKRLDATMSAWTSSLQTRNIANVMKGVFTDGMIQYNPSKGMFEKAPDSMGMRTIFEPLTKAGLMDKWDNYAKGKRAQTLVKQKLGVPWGTVSNEEVKKLTGFTKDEANKWISEGQADGTVVKAHDEYQKSHNIPLRNFMLQTGLISPAQKAAIDQLLDYVPFMREMDVEGNLSERGRAGLSGQSSGIKELKGSERKILPLLETITAQTSRIIDAGMKNVAAQRAVGLMQAAGVAERVPTATQPISKNITSIQADLAKLGVDFSRLPQSAKDQLTALMYGPQKQTGQVSDSGIIPVRVNGKLQYYRTEDPALTEALQSLSRPQEDFLNKVIRGGKALQTVTATTAPPFPIANFIKDTLSTFVQQGDAKHLFRVTKGLIKAGLQGQEVKAIQQAGSGGSAFLNVDPKSIRDVLKSDSWWKNRWNDKLFLKTAWNGWKQVLYAAENANRVAIYDKVLEQGGTSAEAAFQAQDTLNFQMHGSSSSLQKISAAVPFLNARMQGAYKIGRSFNQDPTGVALRGGLLVLGSLGLWAKNKADRSDEDANGKNWYERLSNNDKALYWHMKVPGSNEIIRIPKPFEIGTMFATIPEVMADAISDPSEAGKSLKIAGTSTAQALPVVGDFAANLLNTGKVGQSLLAALTGNPIFKVPIELAANRNMFFNAPIVTNPNAPKQAQYNDRTSATARAIGDVTGASPQETDYLINTIFSGLTPYVLLASDSIAKSAGYQGAMPKKAVDYLGFGRFTRDSETMPNRYTPDFYELKNEVDDAYATARWMATEATEQDALEKFRDDNSTLLTMKKPIAYAEKQLKSFKEQLSRVRGGEGTLDEKRLKEDAILKRRNEVLAKTMKFYQELLDGKKQESIAKK